jgi:hypothetical protein
MLTTGPEEEVRSMAVPLRDLFSWLDDELVPIEELCRRQGIRPLTMKELMSRGIPDPWSSDEEHREFLEDLYASRQAGLS